MAFVEAGLQDITGAALLAVISATNVGQSWLAGYKIPLRAEEDADALVSSISEAIEDLAASPEVLDEFQAAGQRATGHASGLIALAVQVAAEPEVTAEGEATPVAPPATSTNGDIVGNPTAEPTYPWWGDEPVDDTAAPGERVTCALVLALSLVVLP